ncbi:branched-chain amino acid aminotransferase [Heyndrickxia acidicola]|uniref:Branched-chain-amino-acid aminotransferase n=1 Tax=Heyndrickxia acidicola TaxID=209389 RepID=A0ABU6MHV8_9BACI|nr:branched-chain amino acid aminotransferase [Heyndrickxia acidicola]MED1204024.1 branched-chain amino acid aminotransferase [Heyndrickxia acidicola]
MSVEKLQITLSEFKKAKPDVDHLEFGTQFTDHMFVMDYSSETGWHDARIVPYQPITLDPACMVFHYGQTVFEGLKAYLTADGEVLLFRPEKNMARLNQSNERLCIPPVNEEFVIYALKRLIQIDREWIPAKEEMSLYIRPFVISTEPYLGVAPSKHFKLIIIMSPVGSYYKSGVNPVKILVENDYVRAVAGGTGTAKTGGNYAASLKAQEVAAAKGYSQVLWLDGIEKNYIEEVGSMNIFFIIDGEAVTPALNGSILEGVTRNSVIQLLKHWDIPVSERRISIKEIFELHEEGKVTEAFGTGTAAVISPVGELNWKDKTIVLNGGKTGEISQKLYTTITGIQKGSLPDVLEWTQKADEGLLVK